MSEHLNNHISRSDAANAPGVSMRTELLRAAADNELSPAQRIDLDRHLAAHPEDQRVIDVERQLRKLVADAAPADAAPARFRERILAMSAASGADRSSIPFSSATARARNRFSRPMRWFALAASVAIVAGGSFVVLRNQGGIGSTDVQIAKQFRTSLVSFIGAQHDECEVHADMIGGRFKTTKMAEVPTEFAQVLGTSPDIGHIDSPDFKLLGAGPCAVPGRGKSVRMVLECTADRGGAGSRGSLVSIHIQQDTGELNLESGKTYRLADRNSTGYETSEIFVWRRDGFIYFLTSRSEPAMQMARAAFGAREPSGTL
ncbi:MAG: anti-sigma factor [Phycisphaerales bacterium]